MKNQIIHFLRGFFRVHDGKADCCTNYYQDGDDCEGIII